MKVAEADGHGIEHGDKCLGDANGCYRSRTQPRDEGNVDDSEES